MKILSRSRNRDTYNFVVHFVARLDWERGGLQGFTVQRFRQRLPQIVYATEYRLVWRGSSCLAGLGSRCVSKNERESTIHVFVMFPFITLKQLELQAHAGEIWKRCFHSELYQMSFRSFQSLRRKSWKRRSHRSWLDLRLSNLWFRSKTNPVLTECSASHLKVLEQWTML